MVYRCIEYEVNLDIYWLSKTTHKEGQREYATLDCVRKRG
jgi:hypothetical protein